MQCTTTHKNEKVSNWKHNSLQLLISHRPKSIFQLAALRISQGRAIYSAFPGTLQRSVELPMLGLPIHLVHTEHRCLIKSEKVSRQAACGECWRCQSFQSNWIRHYLTIKSGYASVLSIRQVASTITTELWRLGPNKNNSQWDQQEDNPVGSLQNHTLCW